MSAGAGPDHPTDQDSYSATYKIKIAYVTNDANDKPPTAVTYSWDFIFGGGYDYVLFGSTTTHYSVSADFNGDLSVNGIPTSNFGSTMSGDSGTISQSAQEQTGTYKDPYPLSAQNVSISPNWTRSTANGTITYSYTLITLDASGHANATALGWSPPPHPPGTSPAVPNDFSSGAFVVSELNSFSLGSSSGGGGSTPPSGPPSGGGD